MIDDNNQIDSKKIEDSLVQKPNNIYIQDIFDELNIELPSFNEILSLKKIGQDNIKINSMPDSSLEFSDIVLYEKENLLKHYDSLNKYPKYQYQLASLYNILGNNEEADKLLNSIKDINDFYHHKYALSLLKKDFKSGVSELKKNNSAEDYISLSLAYLQKREILEACSTISIAYEKFDYNQRINSVYGLVEELLGNYQHSISLFKEIIFNGDNLGSIYYLLSLDYLFTKNFKRAYKYALIAVYLNPNNRDSLLMLCQLSYIEKTYSNIIPKLESHLISKPKDVVIWSHLSLFHFYNHNYSECKKAIGAILSLDEDNYSAWNNLAVISIEQKEFDKAHKYFAQALKNVNDVFSNNVLINYFNFLFNSKNYSMIVDLYKKIMSTVPLVDKNNAYKYHEYYLYSEFELCHYDKYISLLKDLKSSYSDSNEIVLKLLNDLICYYCTIDFNSIYEYSLIEELEVLLRSNKFSKEYIEKSYNNILFAYLEYEDLKNSNNYINRLRNRLDNNPYFIATYGLYCFKHGDIKKGEKLYKKAIDFSPDQKLQSRLIRKRDLELAKYYLKHENLKQAENLLTKVLAQSDSEDFIKAQATMLYKMT